MTIQQWRDGLTETHDGKYHVGPRGDYWHLVARPSGNLTREDREPVLDDVIDQVLVQGQILLTAGETLCAILPWDYEALSAEEMAAALW